MAEARLRLKRVTTRHHPDLPIESHGLDYPEYLQFKRTTDHEDTAVTKEDAAEFKGTVEAYEAMFDSFVWDNGSCI